MPPAPGGLTGCSGGWRRIGAVDGWLIGVASGAGGRTGAGDRAGAGGAAGFATVANAGLAAGCFAGVDSARAFSTSFLANENLSRLEDTLRFFTASSAAARCCRNRSAKASSFAPLAT